MPSTPQSLPRSPTSPTSPEQSMMPATPQSLGAHSPQQMPQTPQSDMEEDAEAPLADGSQLVSGTPLRQGTVGSLSGTPATPLDSVSATPLMQRSPSLPRGDLGRLPRVPATPGSSPSERAPQQQQPGGLMDLDTPAADPNANSEYEEAVIWGTNVNVQAAMDMFRQFLRGYRFGEGGAEAGAEAGADPYYLRVLQQIHEAELSNLNIDCKHIYAFAPSRKLYGQFVHYPQEVVPIMDLVVHEEYTRMFGEPPAQRRIQVRPFGLLESKPMRDLNPTDIDQMVSLSGMVTRCSAVIPDLKQAFFRCLVCNSSTEVMIDRGRIEEPTSCGSCNSKHSMELLHNRSLFTDKQRIRLQESPDSIPEGETPHTVNLFAFDDLVDGARPGDRLEVTGIYRALPLRLNPKRTSVQVVYKTYVDVIHFRSVGPQCAADGDGEDGNELSTVSEARARKLKEMSRRPNIYTELAESIAPSIWELGDLKKGVLCQLFGGVNRREDDEGKKGNCRGDLNVLLCGDPGTSKSQLLSYVHKVAPRGIYTSGKGSSAVGLTASVVHDPETKELVLESGALVLSDRGMCCIDEFDKMSDTTRAVLHEAMEQQTVSIAKAGIIATLNSRTSILASANPVESRYNPQLSVVENIKLPPTLLSRFDLIYLVLDKPNAANDRRLAQHLVSLYHDVSSSATAPIDSRTLTEYISYARDNIFPQISDDAARDLIEVRRTCARIQLRHSSLQASNLAFCRISPASGLTRVAPLRFCSLPSGLLGHAAHGRQPQDD